MSGAAPRIAGAPISWGVCEAPGWGLQLDPNDVFAEIAAAGFAAAEAGPDGYLPGDGAATREALAGHGLELAGAFLPVALHTTALREQSMATLEQVLERLAASPGAALSLAVMGDRSDFAARETLTAQEWRATITALDEVAARAGEHGVPCGVHQHAGTAVERMEDLARVLERSSIGISLDTGHLVLGGIDPVQVVCDSPERVTHVHLKDVDAAVAERWREGSFATYREAVDAGLYTQLGVGDSGIAEAVQELATSGYTGWYVVERDMAIGEDDLTTSEDRIDSGISERTWVERCIAGASRGVTR